MANISDACGHVSLIGDWTANQVRAISYVLASQDIGADYNTYYGMSIAEMTKILLAGEELGFSASGRWSFRRNLESLNEWSICTPEIWALASSNLKDEQIPYEDYLAMRAGILKEMSSSNLQIAWSFVDYEGGWSFLVESTGHHMVDADNNLVYYEDECEDYAPNVVNYCRLFEDSEALDCVVANIAELYGVSEEQVESLIKMHETAYYITPFTEFESIEDVPEELNESLQFIKAGLNDSK